MLLLVLEKQSTERHGRVPMLALVEKVSIKPKHIHRCIEPYRPSI